VGRNKSYNKEEVLNRALSTFWKKGFENTSMRDLAKSTGINLYSLYAEFEDKNTLFNEVLRTYQKTNLEFATNVLSNGTSGYESIKKLF